MVYYLDYRAHVWTVQIRNGALLEISVMQNDPLAGPNAHAELPFISLQTLTVKYLLFLERKKNKKCSDE